MHSITQKSSLRRCLLKFTPLVVGLHSTLWGVAGVADTVIISGDLTYWSKWSNELQQWNRVVAELQQQTQQNNEMIRLLGDASHSAGSVVGSVSKVTEATGAALAIETRSQALERGRAEKGIKSNAKTAYQADKRVYDSYAVLGTKYERDSSLYEPLAIQQALRERVMQAVENQEKVAGKELTSQRELLERLRSAKNDSDIQLVHAGIAASQERLELARQKLDQTREELRLFESELQAETEKKRVADKEWGEKFTEKLRARAMTSLHAQKSGNL